MIPNPPMAGRRQRRAAARGRTMTTVELPPALLKSARVLAADRGTTLRALIEEGLRAQLSAEQEETT